MGASEFLFVTVNRPDDIKEKKTQRAIRQRVMRDIGRSRRKPKDPPAMTFIGVAHEGNYSDDMIRPALKSNPLPIELNDRAHELVHFSKGTTLSQANVLVLTLHLALSAIGGRL